MAPGPTPQPPLDRAAPLVVSTIFFLLPPMTTLFCQQCGARLSSPRQKLYCSKTCRQKGDNRRLREEFLREYGGRCQCPGGCDIDEPDFLSLDHIFNDGAAHRKLLRRGSMYRELKRLGWPKDRYRLLCYNCNLGRTRHGGRCPHESNASARGQSDTEMEIDMDLALVADLQAALPPAPL
jgi:hypothetical protein